VPRDAFVAAKLREAGAIFIGKANLSEWSGMRGKWGLLTGQVPNGLSERGGQTFSPYYPNAHPSSSSSGSGVAMAIGLAAGSLGSETHGSIVSPSSRNNVVGIKPTIGLVSRSGGNVSSNGLSDFYLMLNASNTYFVSSRYSWPDVSLRC
jgi:amidase